MAWMASSRPSSRWSTTTSRSLPARSGPRYRVRGRPFKPTAGRSRGPAFAHTLFADMVSGASRHPVASSGADPSSGATRLWRAYSRRSGATRARSGSARRSPPPTRVQIGASGSSVCSGSVVTATAVERSRTRRTASAARPGVVQQSRTTSAPPIAASRSSLPPSQVHVSVPRSTSTQAVTSTPGPLRRIGSPAGHRRRAPRRGPGGTPRPTSSPSPGAGRRRAARSRSPPRRGGAARRRPSRAPALAGLGRRRRRASGRCARAAVRSAQRPRGRPPHNRQSRFRAVAGEPQNARASCADVATPCSPRRARTSTSRGWRRRPGRDGRPEEAGRAGVCLPMRWTGSVERMAGPFSGLAGCSSWPPFRVKYDI